MLVRVRPTVMISSTIGELATERRQIGDALSAARLADGWLFETHAAAAGEPPEDRYLEIARSCDLYVIVLAAQGSEATEAEYHAAYQDNSRKVLPFFVGDPTDATKALRDLIESRHIRVSRAGLPGLASAVVDAVTDQVRSGGVVRPSLLENLGVRLRRAEQVVRTTPPISFIPALSPSPDSADKGPSTEPLPATSVSDGHERVALEGIGGSGKTYGALAMLQHASRKGRLPLLVQPTGNVLSMHELITGEFEAVRFFPGDALTQQFARDGQLAIVVDGIDSISTDQRRVFLHDVDEFARRFPRSLVICCVRRLLPDELRSFTRFTLDPLSDEQTADMFRSAGVPQIRTFPTQVADLARWPLWAWALLEVGPNVPTGLVLLQQLLEHRIGRSGAYSPIEREMLIDAASALAFRAWPQPSMPARDALSTLVTWAAGRSVERKFAVPPAETVIERLSAAGIVHLVPDLVFAHPLFATYLAAHHAAVAEPMTDPMTADPEFAMFVAALLGEDQSDTKLALLLRHGPVGQARYLRLAAEGPRDPQRDDPTAFGAAVRALSGSAAECIVTDNWTAWRAAVEPRSTGADAVQRWLAIDDVNFVPGQIFKRRSPMDVATIESLARFKDHVARQRPDEDRFHRVDEAGLKRLRKLPREELNELILQAVLDWSREWRERRVDLGLATLPETALGDGDPQVIVYEDWPDPGLRIEWGGTANVAWVQPNPKEHAWYYTPLSRFLDPGRSARIYQELVERAERALGCTFGSQAWSRPEHVAAWAW